MVPSGTIHPGNVLAQGSSVVYVTPVQNNLTAPQPNRPLGPVPHPPNPETKSPLTTPTIPPAPSPQHVSSSLPFTQPARAGWMSSTIFPQLLGFSSALLVSHSEHQTPQTTNSPQQFYFFLYAT